MKNYYDDSEIGWPTTYDEILYGMAGFVLLSAIVLLPVAFIAFILFRLTH